MTALRIALGAIGLLMVIVSLVAVLRFYFYPPPFTASPFIVEMDAGQVSAEFDRLSELTDKETGASLGRLAAAAEGCIRGAVGTGLPDKVERGARRLFIVYYALRNGVESPLIDPRMADVSLQGPPSLDALIESWGDEGQSPATIERWKWFMAGYFDAANPIYDGLGINPDSFDAQDLDKVFIGVRVTGGDFGPCVASRAG